MRRDANGVKARGARRAREARGGTTLTALAALTVLLGAAPAAAAPRLAVSTNDTAGSDTVVFSGGCFWGVQAVFEHVTGVSLATAGYAGGSAASALYEVVGTGETGHAESVQVIYDPSQVTFDQLLQVFFAVAHDPTELNRQGPDVGTQYRSAIWHTTDEQRRAARAYVARLTEAKAFPNPIVTEINALAGFHPAETHHQDYVEHHPYQPYVLINDLPKVARLRQAFPGLWREEPVAWHPGASLGRP